MNNRIQKEKNSPFLYRHFFNLKEKSLRSGNQSVFICIASNHNKVISRHFTHRAGSKPNSSGFNFKETQHSHMSNSGKEKLPFNF